MKFEHERTTDMLDAAVNLTELQLNVALHNNRQQFKTIDLRGHGDCLYCGEETPEFCHNGELVPSRWCDSECRDNWQKLNRGWNNG